MEKLYKLKDLPVDKVFFWSYDFENAKLPMSEIIWKVIEKGDIDDLVVLLRIFPEPEIKKIYIDEIRPILSGGDKEYYKLRPGAKTDNNTVWLMDTIFRIWDEYVA